MFLQRLRQATRAQHEALERQLPLLDPALSRDSYRDFVSRFFGYYAPLEARLLAAPGWSDIGLAYLERRKLPQLERDLRAFGATTDTLAAVPLCRELPDVASSARLLGCLYVIEGATLGGQIITRRLQASLGLTPESGAAFFSGYGAQTGSRWKAFGALLTAYVQRTGGDDEVIASANRTFATMEGWMFARPLRPATRAAA